MVIVMATLIIYGDISFSQVPINSQPAVKARLESLGYGPGGQPLLAAE